MVLIMGFFATLLAGCGGGASFAKDMTAGLDRVPGVVSAQTEFNNSAGMSSRINVRLEAASDADLHSVLEDSLRAFADASGSTKGTISVAYYVFAAGAPEDGIRPDAVGLNTTPSVEEIRQYAGR
jgi:hypothetical protein